MRLTIIGSGTSLPQIRRGAPCCLLQEGGKNIVVDLGSGTSRGIFQAGVHLRDVGLVVLTHLHPDHCADLVPFLFALRAEETARRDPLLILGPEGLRKHYSNLQRTWGHWVEGAGYDLSVMEWAGPSMKWGPLLLGAAPTAHSVPNLAWYIGALDRSGVILTGDGEKTDDLVKMGRMFSHTLVAECSLPPGRDLPGHMNPAQAADLAVECGSRALVLTHLNPGVDAESAQAEARERFEGDVTTAEDGLVIEV